MNEIAQRRARMSATFALLSQIANQEVQAEFAKYLCVLVYGFFEQAVRDIILAYTSQNSNQAVARYVERTIERRANLNAQRLEELVGLFDADWRKELNEYIVDDRRAALGNVLEHRNAIAHGRDSTITLRQVEAYYTRINEVLDFLVGLTFPQ